MSEVAVLLADGFEEIEGLTVVDVLRRAGISLTTASIMKREQVTGAHQIQVKADCLWEEMDFSEVKMVVLPGGFGGMQNLEAHEGVRTLLHQFSEEHRYISAICAAPTILGRMGLLEGKQAACYPSMEEGLVGANVCFDGVVSDGTIITARGMGVSIDFALRLVERLRDKALADEIAEQIVYRR